MGPGPGGPARRLILANLDRGGVSHCCGHSSRADYCLGELYRSRSVRVTDISIVLEVQRVVILSRELCSGDLGVCVRLSCWSLVPKSTPAASTALAGCFLMDHASLASLVPARGTLDNQICVAARHGPKCSAARHYDFFRLLLQRRRRNVQVRSSFTIRSWENQRFAGALTEGGSPLSHSERSAE